MAAAREAEESSGSNGLRMNSSSSDLCFANCWQLRRRACPGSDCEDRGLRERTTRMRMRPWRRGASKGGARRRGPKKEERRRLEQERSESPGCRRSKPHHASILAIGKWAGNTTLAAECIAHPQG